MCKVKIAKALALGMVVSTLLSATAFAAVSTEAVKGTPVVDGTLEDVWNSAKVIDVNVKQPNSVPDEPATAKVRAMWDEKNLYVFAEVFDSKLNKDAKQQPWEVDSIEFFIDENNSKGTYYDGDDAQYRVDIDNIRSGGSGAQLDLFTQSAVVKTDKGYIVEAAIPLRRDAKEGQVIGFDSQVNDDTGAGKREGIVGWSQTNEDAFANPSVFGTMTLAAAGSAAPAAPADDTSSNPSTGDASVLAYAVMAGLSAVTMVAKKRSK